MPKQIRDTDYDILNSNHISYKFHWSAQPSRATATVLKRDFDGLINKIYFLCSFVKGFFKPNRFALFSMTRARLNGN